MFTPQTLAACNMSDSPKRPPPQNLIFSSLSTTCCKNMMLFTAVPNKHMAVGVFTNLWETSVMYHHQRLIFRAVVHHEDVVFSFLRSSLTRLPDQRWLRQLGALMRAVTRGRSRCRRSLLRSTLTSNNMASTSLFQSTIWSFGLRGPNGVHLREQ